MATYKNDNELLSDEEIIELYWRRNERAIQHTDKKYGRYLYTIAYNIVHDRLDSEECLNDTYLGTWNQIPPTRPNVFQAFLAKITRNIAVDKYRNSSAEKRMASELSCSMNELRECMSHEPSVEEEYAIREMCRILNEYLHSISEKDEFIFVCRYYYSDRISDIAKMLGVSDRTIYRSLSEMRAAFKKKIEEEGYGYES